MKDADDPSGSRASELATLERLLVRSAHLDRPRLAARERARERGLEALTVRPARSSRRLAFGLGVALAAAAALALLSRSSERRTAEVSAERIRTKTGASARPAEPTLPPACPALVVARGDAPLIEDWERSDGGLLAVDGRRGSWTTYDDGTGVQTFRDHSVLSPSRIPGGRGASRYALHVAGGHFTKWGAIFGTELADAACYDASAYAGLEFWAKGPGELQVGLQMIDVQEVKHGGFCKQDCYDSHRKVIELGPTFRKYQVLWSELRQLYVAGRPLAFDPRRVRFLEFAVAAPSTPFDLWLDDVSFIRR